MDLNYLLSLSSGFLITAVLLKILQPVAHNIGLVDVPSHRKNHLGDVPLTGGLAMFLGLGFALLTLDLPLSQLRAFIGGAMILVTVGLLDDLHELSPTIRFAAQIISATLMATWGGVMLNDFGMLISDNFIVELGWLALPITIFSTVGVINALNMVDGVNGLAGSVSLVSVIGMIIIAITANDTLATHWLGIVAVVLFAFLLFNWRFGKHQAKTFMGDSGSMLIGFVLAWSLIDLSQGEQRAMSPVTALWLFAIPLIDTLTMMVRRIRKRQSPFTADCEHFHHLLQCAGVGKFQTTIAITLMSILYAGFGLYGHFTGIPEYVMFYLFLSLFFIHLLIIMRAWKTMRFLKKHLEPSGGSSS